MKLRVARTAMAAVAALALMFFVAVPVSHADDRSKCQHAIEKAESGSRTDFSKPFIHFQQFLNRRGIVIVISDFYEDPAKICRLERLAVGMAGL